MPSRNKKENNGYPAPTDKNRFKMAKSMAPFPGGPMGNPDNVISMGAQQSGPNQTMYKDFNVQTDATQVVMPAPPSNKPQNFVSGTPRGKNPTPYGLQQQPPPQMMGNLETAYNGMQSMQRGVQPSNMGPYGGGPLMGAVPGNMPGNGNVLPMAPPQAPPSGKGGKGGKASNPKAKGTRRGTGQRNQTA